MNTYGSQKKNTWAGVFIAGIFFTILSFGVFPQVVQGSHESWSGGCVDPYCGSFSSDEAAASAACAAQGGSFSSIYIPSGCEGTTCFGGGGWFTCDVPHAAPTCATNPTMDGCPCTKSNACNTSSGSYSGGSCSAPEPAPCPCPADSSCAASTCSSSTCSDSCGNVYPGTMFCGGCPADPSCAASTCTGSSCFDSCGNMYGGTMFCGGCPADPSCAASTCTGSTCSDSCGNVYSGTLFCGGCVADPSCAASTCTGSSCSDSCGNVYAGTAFCPSDSLKICENSCSSGLQRSGSSFSMATGSTRNLVACWNTASGCSDSSGNVTTSASWSEGGGSAISLSGSNPRVVNANSAGSESVTTTYSGNSVSTTVSVSCVPSVTCATAPQGTNYCPSDTYTVNDGCGTTLTCNGRRDCDFNWKEVAP